MLDAIRHFLGLDRSSVDPLPNEIRQAAGNLVNAATNLSAQARVIERQDPFEKFVHAMRGLDGRRTDS